MHNAAVDLTVASAAVAHAEAQFDSGEFFRVLAGRVACRTESQNPARAPELQAYLAQQIAPALQALGDRKSTRLNSSHLRLSRMPSSA